MSKSIEQRIKELEDKNQLLTDNLVDAIWVIDVGTMTYEYITPSIRRISGFSPEEIIGRPVQNQMAEKSYNQIKAKIDESLTQLNNGQNPRRELEVEMTHRNGTPYWVEINARLLNEKDKPLKIIGIMRDVTQRKQYEISQKELIKKLSDLLSEKELLLAENKMLQELLPVCSGCKRIRDDNNLWWPLDFYVERHTKSKVSHTICPDCKSVLYEKK